MSSPFTALAAPVTGTVGTAVGAASFLYNVIKDHGSELKFTQASAPAAFSTVPPGVKTTNVEYVEHSGIWYTHTRAWHAAMRSKAKHDKETDPSKFASSYLCTVFPFTATYTIAQVDVAELTKSVAVARDEVANALATADQALTKLLERKKALSDPGPGIPRPKQQVDALRDARELERVTWLTDNTNIILQKLITELDKEDIDLANASTLADKAQKAVQQDCNNNMLAMFSPSQPQKTAAALKKLVDEIPDLSEARKDAAAAAKERATLRGLVQKEIEQGVNLGHYNAAKLTLATLEKRLEEVEADPTARQYITDFRLAPDVTGRVEPKSWQNVKVEGNFTLAAVRDDPLKPGVAVDMEWIERVVGGGYNKRWAFRMVFVPGQENVNGGGKLVTRFNQFVKADRKAVQE